MLAAEREIKALVQVLGGGGNDCMGLKQESKKLPSLHSTIKIKACAFCEVYTILRKTN